MSNVIDDFHQLSDLHSLKSFVDKLGNNSELDIALKIKIDSWMPYIESLDGTFFPERFISKDHSAALYGQSPVVFLGGNNWAVNRLRSGEDLQDRVEFYKSQIDRVSKQDGRKYCFLIVPEKDFIMDKIANRREFTSATLESMGDLREHCVACGATFVFDDFMSEYPSWVSEDDYVYYDSHLLGRDYVAIFHKIISSLGISASDLGGVPSVVSRQGYGYGDFRYRLLDGRSSSQNFMIPEVKSMGATVKLGNEVFETPMSKNSQTIVNDKYSINAKIAVFGDSHSSIFAQQRLTYLLSSVFRICEFEWNPWGSRDLKTDADFVLMEMSQRFMYDAI
jgi:hypothetical protein